MLIKPQRGSYIVNLDNVEAITIKPEEGGEVAIYARTPDGDCYTLGRVDTQAEAQAIIQDIAGSLSAGAGLYTIPGHGGKRHKRGDGAALEWTPHDARAYHLGKRAEEQPAAINFYPDNPQPTPAERRAAAEAQAAAARAAYHRAHRKNAEQAEGRPLDWTETITAAEEAEIKAYNAQTTAENLDVICCNYPPDAHGAIITQSGETITDPDCWDMIHAIPATETAGNLSIILEERALDDLGDARCDILGTYPEEQATRIYRDLRAQIEGGGDPVKIVMPD